MAKQQFIPNSKEEPLKDLEALQESFSSLSKKILKEAVGKLSASGLETFMQPFVQAEQHLSKCVENSNQIK